MKRVWLVVIAAAALLQVAVLPAAAQKDALRFFKNYFVTGDYVAAGVGLRGTGADGLATGEICVGVLRDAGTWRCTQTPDPDASRQIPQKADIVAAFLYWQVVTTTKLGPDSGSLTVTFSPPQADDTPRKVYPLASSAGPFGLSLGAGTPPCWSSGGGTGPSGGTKLTYTYRADVLRFLDIDKTTGKPVANGAYQVQVPDSGSGGAGLPLALGASLVIVYRDAANLDRPLSAIVIYDGTYTLDNSTRTMFQNVLGFYDPAISPNAKVTHIVGSGQANKSETLSVGSLSYLNPFGGFDGPNWDTVTLTASPSGDTTCPDGVSGCLRTSVTQCADCLTWGAVILKTDVKDKDGDGLLDKWETTSGLSDPNNQPLPDLPAMGADPEHKDLFIEIGYMTTNGAALTYGGVEKPAHSHLPGWKVVREMGEAFANAPVDNPDLSTGISLHVDVGPICASPTAEGCYQASDKDDPSKTALPYLVPTSQARGGEAIDETVTQTCTASDPHAVWVCQYPDYPGTVGWKTGFRFLRDEVLSVTAPPGKPTPPPGEEYCQTPGYTCNRRFDHNRKDIFHYALFAHAIGLPKSDQPCLEQTGTDEEGNPIYKAVPLTDFESGLCAINNPDFHVPRTQTGIADFPGGDILETMAFPDNSSPVTLPIGTWFAQAGTFMHELGHNLERRHGGESFEPNCKPNFFSVLNYSYQLRGLVDELGVAHLDYSRSVIDPIIDEANVGAGTTLSGWPTDGTPRYRAGWYAPVTEGSYLKGPYDLGQIPRAKKHCDGSEMTETIPWVRVDARVPEDPIDWDANLTTQTSSLDINFNGTIQELSGSDDWANLRLNQVGARRQVGGLYLDGQYYNIGPLSLDVGRGDGGRGDGGLIDLGRGDGGVGDFSRGDLGRGDGGRGDGGRGDGGGGDMFGADPNNPACEPGAPGTCGGELDLETASDLSKTPPVEFAACVIQPDGTGTGACSGQTDPVHRVRLDWKAPNAGGATGYIVYRVDDDTLENGKPWNAVATLAAGTYFTVDPTELVDGSPYIYFGVAVYPPEPPDHPDPIQSDPSNIVQITGVNDPPTAGHDAYQTAEDTPLTVPAPGVLSNDTDPDSAVQPMLIAVLVQGSGPAHGTLAFNADGSFTYTPALNYNGTDSFKYKAQYGSSSDTNEATVTLTVTPVNDAPVAESQAVTTAEDTARVIPLPPTDVDGDSLTYIVVTGPAHGSLSVAGASLTYTPAANYNGPDGFTFKANDGTGDSNVATVSITVTPVNDPPVANADSYTVVKEGTLTVAAPGVLANDTDVDGNALTAVKVSDPSHGTLVWDTKGNGSFIYTPAAGYLSDTFTYKASDGSLTSDVATVTINVKTYSFVGTQNCPPAATTIKAKAGSTVPMAWQYRDGAVVVYSATATYSVIVKSQTTGATYGPFTNTDPGSSSFRYDATSKTWYFNLQTKDKNGVAYPVDKYWVSITPTPSGYLPPPTTPFTLNLTK